MPITAIAVLSIEFLRHGVLLVFGAPGQLKTLAGQEHGRTIPLADVAAKMSVCLWETSSSGYWDDNLFQA
jgi:hypothetical protein